MLIAGDWTCGGLSGLQHTLAHPSAHNHTCPPSYAYCWREDVDGGAAAQQAASLRPPRHEINGGDN
eukprot:7648835-Pyramimonas_sp.AAC.1